MKELGLIKAITELGEEIKHQKAIIKELKTAHKYELLALSEYDNWQAAKTNLKTAKTKLESAVSDDSRLLEQAGKLQDEGLKLKDLKEILSNHLVTYFQSSGFTTVKIDDTENIAREVVISARLGRTTESERES